MALIGFMSSPVLVKAAEPETTPLQLPDSEPFVFRKIGEVELRLHVVKPKRWAATDARPSFVCIFGGGWKSGTPEKVMSWAKWAADRGMVGIAPDYRTLERMGGQPEDCISDGRAAISWIAQHAAELGIDPKKMVVFGSSAGGHVAIWTAISAPGPGNDEPAPETLPAALVLINPVTDTTDKGYGGVKRFGSNKRAQACSVNHHLPAKMPPTIVFHATADKLVPYATAVTFRDQMTTTGNRCELVTFEGLGHSYYSTTRFGEEGRNAYRQTTEKTHQFLLDLGLVKK